MKAADAPSRARQRLKADDILVSTVRPNLNGVARVPKDLNGAIASTGFCVLRPRSSLLCSGYLFHWVKSPWFIGAMTRRATGASYPAVTDSIVFDSTIPLPPLPAQRRIAAILDKADALREKRRAALEQLDQLLTAIFLAVVGDPAVNPKQWSRHPLSEVVAEPYGIKAGPFGSSLKKEEYTPNGYRVYGQEQVLAGRFDVGDYYISERKYQKLKSCAVSEGDVLVSLVGSFGKVLVVPNDIEPGIINPRLLKITPRKQILRSEFLASMLVQPSVQRQFEQWSHGGTMGILNASLMKRLIVPVPPIEVQDRFIAAKRQLERLRHCHTLSLQICDSLFSSLQQRAFTGAL